MIEAMIQMNGIVSCAAEGVEWESSGAGVRTRLTWGVHGGRDERDLTLLDLNLNLKNSTLQIVSDRSPGPPMARCTLHYVTDILLGAQHLTCVCIH